MIRVGYCVLRCTALCAGFVLHLVMYLFCVLAVLCIVRTQCECDAVRCDVSAVLHSFSCIYVWRVLHGKCFWCSVLALCVVCCVVIIYGIMYRMCHVGMLLAVLHLACVVDSGACVVTLWTMAHALFCTLRVASCIFPGFGVCVCGCAMLVCVCVTLCAVLRGVVYVCVCVCRGVFVIASLCLS